MEDNHVALPEEEAEREDQVKTRVE